MFAGRGVIASGDWSRTILDVCFRVSPQIVKLFCIQSVPIAIEAVNHQTTKRVHEWDSDDCKVCLHDVVLLQNQISKTPMVPFLLDCVAAATDRCGTAASPRAALHGTTVYVRTFASAPGLVEWCRVVVLALAVCVCPCVLCHYRELVDEAIISLCALLYGGNVKIQSAILKSFRSAALCSAFFAAIRDIIAGCASEIKPWTRRKVCTCAVPPAAPWRHAA